jgi:hypothetical protein
MQSQVFGLREKQKIKAAKPPLVIGELATAESVVRPWARGVKLVEELEKVDGLAMEEQAKVVGSTMGELATVDLVVAVRGSARKKGE